MTTSALVSLSNSRKMLGNPYLKVQIHSQSYAALAMPFVQEALVLPIRQLTPMPNKPPCLLGLTNRRSRVLWVVDLALLLGLGALPESVQQHNIIIVQVGNMPLGLAVEQVEGIIWLTREMIQPPPAQITPRLLPFLQGCWVQPDELTFLLEVAAIARSQLLHAD